MSIYSISEYVNSSIRTKKGRMSVIKISFSQPGWLHGSNVRRNTTDRNNTMEYTMPFIPLKVTASCNILNHTPIYSISLLTSYSSLPASFLTKNVDQQMPTDNSKYGSSGWPIQHTTTLGGQFRTIRNCLRTATGKANQFRKQTK